MLKCSDHIDYYYYDCGINNNTIFFSNPKRIVLSLLNNRNRNIAYKQSISTMDSIKFNSNRHQSIALVNLGYR